MAVAGSYDFKADGFCFKITSTENRTVEVVKGDYTYSGEKTIPSTVSYTGKVYTVVGIGNYAFSGCKKLTSVTFPNTVTYIGDYAFDRCEKLTDVNLPKKLNSIGEYSFLGCDGLTSINIDCELKEIKEKAFANCFNLEKVTMSNNITKLGVGAFWQDRELKSITLSNNIEIIDSIAFHGCNAVEFDRLVLPTKLKRINSKAFEDCWNIKEIIWNQNLEYIGQYAFSNCGISKIALPSSIRRIDDYAFLGCRDATEIDLPNGLEYIGNGVINCTVIEQIHIPTSVNHVGNSAFGSYEIKEISVSSDNKYYCSLDGVLFNKDMTELVYYPRKKEGTQYIVPNTVEYIECLQGNFLKYLIIPDNVSTLGKDCFYGLKAQIYGCQGLTEIPEDAFNSSNLSSFKISDKAKTIYPTAFGECTNLKQITLGESVNFIGSLAFLRCRSLESIVVKSSTVPELQERLYPVFHLASENATVYSTNCTENDFLTSNGWNYFSNFKTIEWNDLTPNKSILELEAGETFDISTLIDDEQKNLFTSITWESTDDELITVDGNSLATANKNGIAALIVTALDEYSLIHTSYVIVHINGLGGVVSNPDHVTNFTKIYDVNGFEYKETSLDNLPAGLYIIIKNGKSTKFLKR